MKIDRWKRIAAGRRGGSSRSWKKQRAARENGRWGGRPKIGARCPCGEMSAKRAAARGHKCG